MEKMSKQSETNESSSSSDGSKFLESLKEDTGIGKSFMRSLNEKDASTSDTNDSERTEKKGGRLKELMMNGHKTKTAHHMLEGGDYDDPEYAEGPAIQMDDADAYSTISGGDSDESREYRQKQKELIEQGKFREAIQMDIDDIHDKFGNKYDDAIAEMLKSLKDENYFNDSERTEKKGGSYAEVKENSDGATSEVHHMPAKSASELPRSDGPSIKMDREDHKQTASFGPSREAHEYRQKQKELIKEGKFREALQMDIEDIHEKFGNKYDDAIAEMNEYVNKLEEEGYV
jgi:hypothetical protein